MEGPELDLFERSVRHAVDQAGPGSDGEALDAALHELGWSDALREDRQAAVSVLFEAQGATNTTSSALDHLLGLALAVPGDATAGPAVPAVVLPPLGGAGSDPPGIAGEGQRCSVRGIATASWARADRALVVASVPSGGEVALVVATGSLSVRPIEGLDPSLGLAEVQGQLELDPARCAAAHWQPAVAASRLALAHEMVGASRAMLDLARTHALARVQFGQPIARFQAVRHRLAESLVATEGAASLLEAAWETPSPTHAAMAKSTAGRAARTTARHCQQVLAGIGFTTEHPFHRYLRRVLALDQLLGSGTGLTRDLGHTVLSSRTVPPALPL